MKKFFSTFLLGVIFFISATASAAYEETVTDSATLSEAQTFAVAFPMHYKIEATEPTADDFSAIISNASRVSKLKVLSYDEVVDAIWEDASIELKALEENEARKIFNERIAKFADAYILVTSANNNKYVQFFFEVRDSKTGNVLYTFTTQSRYYSKNLKGYTRACEDFYKRLDSVHEKAVKDSKKKK